MLGLPAWVGGGALVAGIRCRAAQPVGGGHADLRAAASAEALREAWTPVEALAIAAHLAGSAALGWAGRHRAIGQRAMPTAMVLDTASTAAALVAGEVARRGRAAGRPYARWSALAAPVLAGGSVLAQGYLAESQRLLPTVRRLRPVPGRRASGAHWVARAVHDLGLAVAFGGALAAVTAVRPTARRLDDPDVLALARWWDPITVVGLAAVVPAKARLLAADGARLRWQHRADAAAAAEVALSTAALGAAAVGSRAWSPWAVATAAGAALLVDAKRAERHRPATVTLGVLRRLERTARGMRSGR